MRISRRGIVLLAAVALPALLQAAPARAEVYPWCAIYSGSDMGGATNCGFSTLAQCAATVSGIGGYCEPNPRYHASAPPPRRQRRHRHD